MTSEKVALRDAKANLSELTDAAAAGEEVVISKHGQPVARLTQARPPRQPIDLQRLRALTNRLPEQTEGAESWMRAVRDEARY